MKFTRVGRISEFLSSEVAFQTQEKLRQGLIVKDQWSPKDEVMQDQ
jgi:hypothetical protein